MLQLLLLLPLMLLRCSNLSAAQIACCCCLLAAARLKVALIKVCVLNVDVWNLLAFYARIWPGTL